MTDQTTARRIGLIVAANATVILFGVGAAFIPRSKGGMSVEGQQKAATLLVAAILCVIITFVLLENTPPAPGGDA